MMGVEYVEVAAVLLERLPGDLEENVNNTRIATVSYQMIARDIYTQVEKPMGRSTYTWNDGTQFSINLEKNVLYVRGTHRDGAVAGCRPGATTC